MKRALAVCSLLFLCPGCSNGVEKATQAWKKAGQTVGEFKKDEAPLSGAECSSGTVAGFPATVCEFADDEAAKKAEEIAFERIGTSVGSAIAEGKTLLVVSDPKKEDPSGRRLNDVIKAFRAEMK